MWHTITAIEVYDAIKGKLGEEESRKLLRYIDEKITTEVATKADLELLRSEIEALEERLRSEIGSLEERLGSKIESLEEKMSGEVKAIQEGIRGQIKSTEERLRGENKEIEGKLGEKIEKTKADIIKWMFIFWIGQIGTLLAILKMAKVF